MKPFRLFFLLLLINQSVTLSIGQVSITSGGDPPHPSAMLEVRSDDKGLLLPRLSGTAILTIPQPSSGLVVFNTTSGKLNYYNGTTWMELCSACFPQPTVAQAGPDQAVNANQTLLAANSPLSGTGVWSIVSGTGGAVADPANPLSLFTGSQPGLYRLAWTITTGCGSSSDTVTIAFTTPLPPPVPGLLFAPYADCLLWPNFQIQNIAETGISQYTCAFIVDNQSQTGANPCWGGFPTLGLTYYQENIDSLRAQGGDIIMSFGGANGIELSYAATNEFEARDAYKAVIDAYDLTSIDFDIEGMFTADPPSVVRRSKAIKLLQTEYPGLAVSLTLPTMPTGLTSNGLSVVQSALAEGVDIHCVNIMAMDYGPSGIDMGEAAISAGEALFLQLKTLYQNAGQNLPDSVLWRKIGITPMIGQNDIPGEVFYLEDAADLATWSATRKTGRLSMWSANRDKACANPGDPLYSCSHIPQNPFEFASIFGSVAGIQAPTNAGAPRAGQNQPNSHTP